MTSKFFYPAHVLVESGGFRKFISGCPVPFKRLFVVTGKSSMSKAGVLEEIENIARKADVEVLIYSGIGTNPTDSEVDEACEHLAAFRADAVMGIGGGSSIDASKIIAMQATNGGCSWDYINLRERPAKKITKDSLPIIAVPTTSGAASESTPYAVITNARTRMKKGIGSPRLYPTFVILDAELLSLMPPRLVAITGFDAFGQALEGFTSKNSTFHSEYYGLSSLRCIVENLEKSWEHPKNYEYKTNMAWGAFLSGLSIGLVDANLAHAMSHPISARFGIQHGLAVVMCTFQAIQFNRSIVGEKYARVSALFGVRVGSQQDQVDGFLEGLLGWTRKFGLDLALKNYDVPISVLEAFADDALQIGAIDTNPRPITREQLLVLYGKVWNGDIR